MTRHQWSQLGLGAVCLIPLAALTWAFATQQLGSDPVETLTHETGEWALRLLILTLCVTPLRQFFGWHQLAPCRRTLGLMCFLYASLHFATYLTFDLGWNFSDLAEEIKERPYVTLGFAAFVILVPLALTSTRRSIKRLGRNWRKLHRWVYLALVLAVLHFIWLVKADLREPLVYAGIAALVLAWRIPSWLGRRPLTYATLRRSRKNAPMPPRSSPPPKDRDQQRE
ncbi:MAG: protein-methionine-sulfoxide reductase heme-binding subunit MsrQ [Myxococcota bacterium]|nr:protein-methionine-sulfoxide reductase heme-binding subunit MsrQ [Myxococcota bacterium]